jgi:hypothetical protein
MYVIEFIYLLLFFPFHRGFFQLALSLDVLKETTTRYNFFQSLHEIKIVKRDMTRGP